MISLDLNKIKKDEKTYKIILIYYIGYVTVKDLRYIKNDCVNTLCVIINKINGCTEESNGIKYLEFPLMTVKDTKKV